MKREISFGLYGCNRFIINLNFSLYRVDFESLNAHYLAINLNPALFDELFAGSTASYATIGHKFLKSY
jgi:hypothetical protein